MLGLSFNTKSNVPVFAVFKCQNIIYLLFIYPYNIHIKQNVLHNFTAVRDNAKQHRFDYIFKLSSVFFSICLTGCFYNDNEQAAFGRTLK